MLFRSALRSGDPAVTLHRLHNGLDDRCFAFARRNGEDQVVVLLNLSAGELSLPVSQLLLQGVYREVFTGNWLNLSAIGNLTLPAWGYAVYEKIRKEGQSQ